MLVMLLLSWDKQEQGILEVPLRKGEIDALLHFNLLYLTNVRE